MPFLALSLCECKQSRRSGARTAARAKLRRQVLQGAPRARCTKRPHAMHGMHAMHSVNIPRSVGY